MSNVSLGITGISMFVFLGGIVALIVQLARKKSLRMPGIVTLSSFLLFLVFGIASGYTSGNKNIESASSKTSSTSSDSSEYDSTDDSSSSSEELSSSSSSDADKDSSLSSTGTAKDLTTGTWLAGKDFDKGYYKITATGGSGNISSTNNSDGFDFSAILGTDVDNDLGQVTSYTGFILKNTELEISGLQGIHLEPINPTQEIDITNIPAGDYIVGGAIPAGRYKLSAVQGSGNVTSTGGLNEVIGTQADTDINQVTNTTVTLKSGDILTTGLQQISLEKQ